MPVFGDGVWLSLRFAWVKAFKLRPQLPLALYVDQHIACSALRAFRTDYSVLEIQSRRLALGIFAAYGFYVWPASIIQHYGKYGYLDSCSPKWPQA
eukprot:6186953-Pleurochrysis_carterae.AAC.1